MSDEKNLGVGLDQRQYDASVRAERDAARSQADALAGALERAEQYIADDGRKPGRKLPANAALADIRSALAAYRGQQP